MIKQTEMPVCFVFVVFLVKSHSLPSCVYLYVDLKHAKQQEIIEIALKGRTVANVEFPGHNKVAHGLELELENVKR